MQNFLEVPREDRSQLAFEKIMPVYRLYNSEGTEGALLIFIKQYSSRYEGLKVDALGAKFHQNKFTDGAGVGGDASCGPWDPGQTLQQQNS